jgi:hypothetical protein
LARVRLRQFNECHSSLEAKMRLATALTLVLALAASAAFCPSARGAEVSGEQVKAAIRKGVKYLRGSGILRKQARYGVGMNALGILAMLHCGVPPTDADLVACAKMCDAGIRKMLKGSQGNTYHVGSVATALAAIDRKRYHNTIKLCATWLIAAQNEDGGWRYQSAGAYKQRMEEARKRWEQRVRQNPRLGGIRRRWNRSRQTSDHSCTQFGLLGLRAAHDIGLDVPRETWKAAEKYLVDTQCKDGGWSYTSPSRSYGSMTAASLGGLYIVGMKLHARSRTCGEYDQNQRIAKGLNWLAKNFTVTENPGRGRSYVGYYLYALERCCAFSARRKIGRHDWYAEGAAHLVKTQNAAGNWGGGHRFGGHMADLDTIFNLLFLGKANSQVLIQKLDYGPKWDTDYHDAHNLAQRVGRELDQKLTWQVVSLRDPVDEWLQAPILYITGHGQLTLDDKQAKKVREFCERGGTIVADACCSNRTFDAAFRNAMAKVFPNVPLAKVHEGHPAYKVPHAIRNQGHHVWEGITTGCRTSVFYTRRDVSCAWDGNIHDPAKSLPGEVAMRLGVNVAAYAMGYKPLKDKLDEVPEQIVKKGVKDDGRVARGALVMAQLKHEGDWDPDPPARGAMLHLYAKATGARVDLNKTNVEPTDADLYKYPLLYMTGHRAFQYDDKAVKALREHLSRGGFLLCDACCGRKEFDKSFRELVVAVFPKHRLERLPADHKIFRMKYAVNTVEYRPILKQELAAQGPAKPHLEAVVVDGRAVLVYSPYDFGCAFEDFPCAHCRGLELPSAKKLLTNILLYAMTE